MQNALRGTFLAVIASLAAGCHQGAPTTEAIPAVTFDALYVVNGMSNSISVVNAVTNEVAGTISLANASFPHHLYASADGAKLALAVPGIDLSGGHSGTSSPHGSGHTGGGAVLVLEAATGRTLVSRTLDDVNHNAIFMANGTEIWTSQIGAATVLVLDSATLETKTTVSVGSAPAEITSSKDGALAFVANGESNSVSVIDVATKMVKQTIPVGAGPVGAWPGNDDVMYVDNEAGKSLSAIDVKTLAVVRTYDLGFTPAFAATAPGGELWVTDTDTGRVVFYQAGSTTKTGEVAVGAGAHAISLAANGATAYVSNQMADSISVIDVATHAVTKTIPVGEAPNGLLFRGK